MYKTTITFQLRPEEKERLKAACKMIGQDMSNFIRGSFLIRANKVLREAAE